MILCLSFITLAVGGRGGAGQTGGDGAPEILIDVNSLPTDTDDFRSVIEGAGLNYIDEEDKQCEEKSGT